MKDFYRNIFSVWVKQVALKYIRLFSFKVSFLQKDKSGKGQAHS